MDGRLCLPAAGVHVFRSLLQRQLRRRRHQPAALRTPLGRAMAGRPAAATREPRGLMALAARRSGPASPASVQARPAAGWRWPALVGGLVTVLSLPPMLLAALRTPAGSIFSGYVVIARDAYVYQAIWRQGWHGAWLFHSPYTAESLPGILLYPLYLCPAHLV